MSVFFIILIQFKVNPKMSSLHQISIISFHYTLFEIKTGSFLKKNPSQHYTILLFDIKIMLTLYNFHHSFTRFFIRNGNCIISIKFPWQLYTKIVFEIQTTAFLSNFHHSVILKFYSKSKLSHFSQVFIIALKIYSKFKPSHFYQIQISS